MACLYNLFTMTTLYLVPTPLGDPDDITLRALRLLREVSAVAADDAPGAQALLAAHQIATPIIPYADAISALSDGGDVALVARAGTPGLGDAAHEIVGQAIARGIRVEALPGASAEITALVLSGLPTEAFVYVGVLPDDLRRYAQERDTLVFAADAAVPTLASLRTVFEGRRIAVAARLTQPNEIVYRGMIEDALAYFREQAASDVLIVVAGAPPEIAEVWDEARVRMELRRRLADGEPLKRVAKAIAELAGWDRRAVYALGVDEKRNTP